MVTINVMYCGDRGITDGMFMSALSLLKHNVGQLNFYILTAGCRYEDKRYYPIENNIASALDAVSKTYDPSNSAKLIDCSELFAKTPLSANLGTMFTPMCMLRLFADLIPEIPDKILYLDYDVMCLKSISPFYETDITGYELAGTLDRYGKWFYKKHPLKFDYVNSGVLLLNMEQIRKNGLFTGCRKMCAEKKMLLPDQSALNKLAEKKLLLPAVFNEQKKADENTVLRHFTTFFKIFPLPKKVTVKPWQTEKMHRILNDSSFDALLAESVELKKLYTNTDIQKKETIL